MTTPVREYLDQEIAEGGNGLLSFNLVDEFGAPVTLAQVGTAELWLFDESTGTTINSKSATNIKNVNGGTIHATSGACTLNLAPADNPIVTAGSRREWHVAGLRITYNGGAGVVPKELAFEVVNTVKP